MEQGAGLSGHHTVNGISSPQNMSEGKQTPSYILGMAEGGLCRMEGALSGLSAEHWP